jgi:hypothetical protein
MQHYITDKTAAARAFTRSLELNNLENLKEDLKIDCTEAKLDLKFGIISKSTYNQIVAMKDYLVNAIEVHQYMVQNEGS